MKVLVCMPHYYDRSRTEHSVLGSSQDEPSHRAGTVDYCIRQIKSMIGKYHYTIGTESSNPGSIVNNIVAPHSNQITGDLVVCTHGKNHLIDHISAKGFQIYSSIKTSPKMLTYECRKVLLDKINDYDLFFYTEDDITPVDSQFFHKIKRFYELFGERKIVLPQRYELFGYVSAKVYLEHPTPPAYRFFPDILGEDVLSMPSFDGPISFERTTNQAAGCYALTREQLKAWARMSYFHEPDPAIPMMVIEQGQVPMLGRYPIYKTALSHIAFLEVHHVPNRACHAKTPASKIATHYRQS